MGTAGPSGLGRGGRRFIDPPADFPAISQLWYAVAVLGLCPWIAVLGARRPTVRVWNWFVLVPLAAVLLWPVALCWMPRGPDRLILETPHLIGFVLVLIMGTGNFLGTIRTPLALGMIAVEAGLLWSVRVVDDTGHLAPLLRSMSAGLLFSLVLGATASRWPVRPPESPWQRLWDDFRNSFGIVWANRLAERVNAEAARGNWSIRLQPGGFVSTTPGSAPDFAPNGAQLDHTLRWLLRRFVDEEWINERLTTMDSAPRT